MGSFSNKQHTLFTFLSVGRILLNYGEFQSVWDIIRQNIIHILEHLNFLAAAGKRVLWRISSREVSRLFDFTISQCPLKGESWIFCKVLKLKNKFSPLDDSTLRYQYNEVSGPLQEAGKGVLNVQVFSTPADQPGLSPAAGPPGLLYKPRHSPPQQLASDSSTLLKVTNRQEKLQASLIVSIYNLQFISFTFNRQQIKIFLWKWIHQWL